MKRLTFTLRDMLRLDLVVQIDASRQLSAAQPDFGLTAIRWDSIGAIDPASLVV
jgi:hypothetical protein